MINDLGLLHYICGYGSFFLIPCCSPQNSWFTLDVHPTQFYGNHRFQSIPKLGQSTGNLGVKSMVSISYFHWPKPIHWRSYPHELKGLNISKHGISAYPPPRCANDGSRDCAIPTPGIHHARNGAEPTKTASTHGGWCGFIMYISWEDHP